MKFSLSDLEDAAPSPSSSHRVRLSSSPMSERMMIYGMRKLASKSPVHKDRSERVVKEERGREEREGDP